MRVIMEAAPSLLATVGAAALMGGVRWVRLLSSSLSRLTGVAETLTDVSADVLRLRQDFTHHLREADERWTALGGAVHPRYLSADDRVPARVPAPAGPAEP